MSITKTFSYQKPSEDQLAKIDKLREAYSTLSNLLNDLCPASRERSIALTELESSSHWANKAITHQEVK